jgi:hypothetical protein
MITSGLMFGRKARLLDDLIRHSQDPRKPKLLEPFNTIRAAKRDVISHSYVASDAVCVKYLERLTSGRTKAIVHTYTFDEFKAHVIDIHNAADAFLEALGATGAVDAFVNAVFNLSSPISPLANAARRRPDVTGRLTFFWNSVSAGRM